MGGRPWLRSYAAVLTVTCRPALVARVMSISRLNFSQIEEYVAGRIKNVFTHDVQARSYEF
jgi:hypothetical protein